MERVVPYGFSAAGVPGVEAPLVGVEEGRRQRSVLGAVASRGGKSAQQLGVDSIGPVGPALRGADQVAELQVGSTARLLPGRGVEPGCCRHHRRADGCQRTAGLVLDQAVGDRRLAAKLDCSRRVLQRREVSAGTFETGNRRRTIGAPTPPEGRNSQESYADPRTHPPQLLEAPRPFGGPSSGTPAKRPEEGRPRGPKVY